MLGGEGADELLLGYRRYRVLARLPRLPALARFAPRWSMASVARLMRAVVADDPAAALLAVTPPAFADAVLAAGLGGRRCWRDLADRNATRGADPVLAARDADLAGYLPRDLLPKLDVALMAAGIEGRCPFLEGDIARFGTTRDALGKAPLRAAFAADLPPEVLRLPKHGFALPLDHWFRGELWLLDLLAERRSRERPHLRPGGIAAAVDRHRARRADLGHGLYLLAACELFLRLEQHAARRTRANGEPQAP
jgi:asparagine synthase (glutamine-hydrolysing)